MLAITASDAITITSATKIAQPLIQPRYGLTARVPHANVVPHRDRRGSDTCSRAPRAGSARRRRGARRARGRHTRDGDDEPKRRGERIRRRRRGDADHEVRQVADRVLLEALVADERPSRSKKASACLNHLPFLLQLRVRRRRESVTHWAGAESKRRAPGEVARAHREDLGIVRRRASCQLARQLDVRRRVADCFARSGGCSFRPSSEDRRRRGGGVGARQSRSRSGASYFERITLPTSTRPGRPRWSRHQRRPVRRGDRRLGRRGRWSPCCATRGRTRLNAGDPRFNPPIFDAAFEDGCTYLDMAMTLSAPHPSARQRAGHEARRRAVAAHEAGSAGCWRSSGSASSRGSPTCSPAMRPTTCSTRSTRSAMRDGADLVVEGYDFAPTFSIWTTIEECLNPPLIWERERGFYTTEPFSEPELFEFPEGIGAGRVRQRRARGGRARAARRSTAAA